jgi:hypothetical protein
MHDVVAFGSHADFFFLDANGKCLVPPGMNVLITTSQPEFGHRDLYKPVMQVLEEVSFSGLSQIREASIQSLN